MPQPEVAARHSLFSDRGKPSVLLTESATKTPPQTGVILDRFGLFSLSSLAMRLKHDQSGDRAD